MRERDCSKRTLECSFKFKCTSRHVFPLTSMVHAENTSEQVIFCCCFNPVIIMVLIAKLCRPKMRD